MFSDIEGSTRLFHNLGDEYTVVLNRHQVVVRKALARYGGHEVKTEGDSFFVAFWDAPSAVAACVDIQRGLAAQRWPHDGEVRVRIGLHTGTAEPAGDDYIALAVHRAARVSAVGHGGQILLSAAAVEAAGDDLPADCSLRSLGRFHLKDFDEPEPLVQVTGPGLESSHPALKAMPAARHNIRVPPTRFVGRRRERLKLMKLLADRPIVTVVAQGGMGKSRLATEVALSFADELNDGATFVELGGVSDDGLVVSTILETLGTRGIQGQAGLAALSAAVQGRVGLIVLDEAELVSAGVAAAAETIAAAAPNSRVLITSRTPLAIEGEEVVSLDPLTIPDSDDDPLAAASDAVAMLLDRLGVDDDSTPEADELQVASALCRRLDGLPLAIELAAARVPQLGLRNVLAGLGDERAHESAVQDAIRWSYGLLGASAQRIFRRLRWLVAPADLEMITAVVCGPEIEVIDPSDVADLMTVLNDRSLIRSRRGDDGVIRYRMLETVREVADTELVAIGESAQVDRSFVQWAASSVWTANIARNQSGRAADDYSGDELLLFLAAIDAGRRVDDPETANILLEITPTLTSRGSWTVLSERSDALGAMPGLSAKTKAALNVTRSRAAFASGDTARGLEHVAAAEALFPELNDYEVALVEGEVANDLLRIDPFKASKFAEHAWPILERANLNAQVGALHAVGATRMMFGNLEGGREAMLRCLALADEAGDRQSMANATAALGNAAFSQGDFAEAAKMLDDAVLTFRELDAPIQLGATLGMAGHAYVLLGDYDQGIAMLSESLALRERFNDVVGALYCKLNLADSYDRAGRTDEARRGFADTFASCERVGVVPLQNAAAHGIAVTAADADAPGALTLLAAAVGRSIGTTGIDEPVTNAALERFRALVPDADAAEEAGRALSDVEFLTLAGEVAAVAD